MGLGMERKAVSCLSDPGSVLAQALVTGGGDMGLLAICTPPKPCDVQGSDPWSFTLAGDPGEVGVLPMVVGGREHRNREGQVPLCIIMAVKNCFLLVYQ